MKLRGEQVVSGAAIFFLAAVFYLISPSVAGAAEPVTYRSGEVLVKFKDRLAVERFKVDPSLDVEAVVAHYRQQPEVAYAEPNYLVRAAAFPNDPQYYEQWYLGAIRARDAWSKDLLVRQQRGITRRSVIAILDTGVDLDHPDLKANIWRNGDERAGDGVDNDRNGYVDDTQGWDFTSEDNDPNPAFTAGYNADAVKHGTLVAGIAAAVSHNGEGITGTSWSSDIMPLRVLDSSGSGDVKAVIEAIEYAIKNGADVINMSFVSGEFNQSWLDAVQAAYDAGIVVVAAAGNTDAAQNGIDLDVIQSYPVCFEGTSARNIVIGVGAVDRDLKKSAFSNYGSCIDVVAPGEAFYSTQVYASSQPDFLLAYNGYWSGTSLATPLVSGAAALIRALWPDMDVASLIDAILSSAKNVDAFNPTLRGKLGAGQLDVAAALDRTLQQQSSGASAAAEQYVVAGLGGGFFPHLKILRQDGTVFKSFLAYSPRFIGVITVASGDVNGDGVAEIITGAGSGGGPHIRIFNVEGQVMSQFFAFDQKSRGGVNVTAGDIDGDGVAEIITGAGIGLVPEVKIFDYRGALISSFLAYNRDFKGGVKVAVGDVNGDGTVEVVTGAGAGGGPHVRFFKPDGTLVGQFFAYNQNFHGGINVAVGDLHGDGTAEIIVSMDKNSLPTVRAFNYRGVRLAEFLAFEPSSLFGVNVAAGDIDGDGVAEIIAGMGEGGGATVRILRLSGKLQLEVATQEPLGYRGGVRPVLLPYQTR